jgi:hypothetical protein
MFGSIAAGRLESVLKRQEGEQAKGDVATVQCLIATVPDPVNSSVSFLFDQAMDSIELAAGTQSYVLERWRIPWRPTAGSTDSTRGASGHAADADSGRAAERPHSATGQPGVLVFRRLQRDVEDGARSAFLVVFCVTETPTHGVDRRALKTSLNLAERLDRSFASAPGTRAAVQSWTARIVGPCFSGSLASLRDAIRAWTEDESSQCSTNGHKHRVDVVSGSATAFAKGRFEHAFRDLSERIVDVRFHSMVHKNEAVIEAVLGFFGVRLRERADRVVILAEFGTGTGQSVSDEGKKVEIRGFQKYLSYQFPLHISEIREKYKAQGLLRDGASETFRESGELRGQTDGRLQAVDVLPDQTPEATAAAENQVLMQAMKYMEDHRIRVVGIDATDANDAVFLVRLIRRYCPDAQIFIVESDLLYLDPESITDLRGVIVGSTYPLYASNHEWSGPNRGTRGRVFPSQYAQGTYNAVVLQVATALGVESTVRMSLLEYRTPPVLAHHKAPPQLRSVPPVWISVVGERALYPLACETPDYERDPDPDYLARPGDSADETDVHLHIYRVVGWAAAFGVLSIALLFYHWGRILATLGP